jgi:hypothetical protein
MDSDVPAHLNWLLRQPTCPVCDEPTFEIAEGYDRQVRSGLWTEAAFFRYRCTDHREQPLGSMVSA